ncbi:SEL1 protein [Gigaspora margarita]|uniref:SEL1 protein n=1 Tax=Gigaspora margarita TaxID=4874 RepID=A0A8H4AU97_GIGMA|nr:SEL1 protein [Gigaspora margarita]
MLPEFVVLVIITLMELVLKKNEHKAFIYYQKSAKIGLASGIFALGNCYKDRIGVEKDKHKAFIYYQNSVDIGYQYGIRVKKNIIMALLDLYKKRKKNS